MHTLSLYDALPISMNKKNYPQRKTTLKWNSNGELSEIDMLRILDKISGNDLNQCELTCDSDQD